MIDGKTLVKAKRNILITAGTLIICAVLLLAGCGGGGTGGATGSSGATASSSPHS